MSAPKLENIDKEILYSDIIKYLPSIIERDLAALSRQAPVVQSYRDCRIGVNGFLHLLELHAGMQAEDFKVDCNAFERWYDEVDYEARFPHYKKVYPTALLRKKKAFEHWVSLQLAPMAEGGGIFMDIGSALSPFRDLVKLIYWDSNTIGYKLDLPREDIGMKPGINGYEIGSSAENFLLEDNSVDRVYSHNALEHFEGGAYQGFFKEAARVLKPGGMVCVTPLFFARKTYAICSLSAFYKLKHFPKVVHGAMIVLDESIQQPYSLHISARDLKNWIFDPLEGLMDFTVYHLVSEKKEYTFPFALVGVKK